MLLAVPMAYSANRALLIGVGKYQLKGADLPGIGKDIEMMRKVALTLGYDKKEIKILLDEKATLKNIRGAINEWLIRGVGEDDNVFFYFSGHGSQIYDKSKDEADKADEVLVTHDAAIGVNTLKNVLVDDMFNEMLEKIPSKNVFILIDACHSGTATRGISSSKGVYPKYLTYPGMPSTSRSVNFTAKSIESAASKNYSALSAAQDNQRAQASNVGSFFTRGVSESILKASKQGRKINMLTLHNETTKYISNQMPDPTLVHKPALVGSTAINSKNLFVEKKAAPQPSPQKKWSDTIVEIAGQASYSIRVKTNGKSYKVGEPLVISCFFKQSGYVNVVTMQPGDTVPTVLFPNEFHPENWVKAGQSVSIPDPDDSFKLTAAPPSGKALIAAFISPFNVNFYKQGYGDGVFKMMSSSSTRGFVVQVAPAAPAPEPVEPKPQKYGAGITYVKIR